MLRGVILHCTPTFPLSRMPTDSQFWPAHAEEDSALFESDLAARQIDLKVLRKTLIDHRNTRAAAYTIARIKAARGSQTHLHRTRSMIIQ